LKGGSRNEPIGRAFCVRKEIQNMQQLPCWTRSMGVGPIATNEFE
jgi:hypothetical protein